MKIFNKGGGWDSKVNFVDENNAVLGYDTGQSCCEHAGWFIADTPTRKIPPDEGVTDGEVVDMPGWVFDTSYFESVEDANEFDCGGMVVFRIVNGNAEKFIHLFNCHNGYYGHGFDLTVAGVKVQGSAL